MTQLRSGIIPKGASRSDACIPISMTKRLRALSLVLHHTDDSIMLRKQNGCSDRSL